jgi:hypothetical protein
MRAPFFLACAVFSLAFTATFEESTSVPEAKDGAMTKALAGNLIGAVDTVRRTASHLSLDQGTPAAPELPAADRDRTRLTIGKVLPEGTEVYAVPRHESYRYAIVNGHRVIVDAASRQIVYIIR